MVHVGNEKELRTLVAIYARVQREQHLVDPHFRIEHAHDLPLDLIPSIAKVGAIVSWQPPLLAHIDRRTAAGLAPPQNLFNCRALLESGVRIAFGTDATPWIPVPRRVIAVNVLARAPESPVSTAGIASRLARCDCTFCR
jgi:predicted amidohydrolase YtcJ